MADISAARDRFRWTILALITISHVVGAAAQYGINTLAPFYKTSSGCLARRSVCFFPPFISP